MFSTLCPSRAAVEVCIPCSPFLPILPVASVFLESSISSIGQHFQCDAKIAFLFTAIPHKGEGIRIQLFPSFLPSLWVNTISRSRGPFVCGRRGMRRSEWENPLFPFSPFPTMNNILGVVNPPNWRIPVPAASISHHNPPPLRSRPRPRPAPPFLVLPL